ncbi:mitochondrial nucleotide exchange factor MGE1 NDAI_0E01300 [Naumovozyma dairenensis CBS 421]|uniref:GrpE protein homolog n=1 Tax=Naumovozyma dairenensis (strain ATCC 10597 / BCRC 20456 / CBS 421 / NBRC 0211 / NRRL Y-12639) TaxID=1071378 RepID=G0WB26_NAUDC|nr:hypothetical protein NDAI_0E01300 [Naumovozyma dairenensis CBS 421]CCD24946.1 hypothetical protein NDAI_0E01300 [Naumovozyma dairenensis CBS 421]
MSALFPSMSRVAPRRLATQVAFRPTVYRTVNPRTVPLMMRLYSDKAQEKSEKTEENANENLTEEQKKIKSLQEELSAKTKEAAELKDSLLRSVADFRNLQNITKKDIQKAKDFALQKFAKDLLESVDNFGHALSAFKEEDLEKSKEIADLYTGVRMTRDVFEKTLKKHGLEKLDPMGETFDPNKHEATFEVAQPDKEPGTVFHVQQVGFTLNDRVIRPAKVGIVKSTDDN